MCTHKYKCNRLDGADNQQQMVQWHWARKARVCYGESAWLRLAGVCVNCDCMLPWKLSLEYKWKQWFWIHLILLHMNV